MNVRGPVMPYWLRAGAAAAPRTILFVVWTAIRLPVLALLVVVEPVARLLLGGLALLLVLVAFFLRFVGSHPAPPFWRMLALAAACVGLLALYRAVIRLLSA